MVSTTKSFFYVDLLGEIKRWVDPDPPFQQQHHTAIDDDSGAILVSVVSIILVQHRHQLLLMRLLLLVGHLQLVSIGCKKAELAVR